MLSARLNRYHGRLRLPPDQQYWGRAAYVWNNTGDTAYVRNPSGTLIDSCSWGSSGSYTYC
jgi:hypothetical protein